MNEEQERQEGKGRVSPFTQKAARFLTKRNERILFLLTLGVAVLATLDAILDFFPLPISIALYVLAAAGFAMTCTLWVKAILVFLASMVEPFTRSNRIVNALVTDRRQRTILTTLPGIGISLIYAIFHGVIGIAARSAWYGSLSAYYLLLCIMRLLSVSYARQIYAKEEQADNAGERELKVYRNCGVILSASSIALGGAVFMLVIGYGGKSYSGLLIYVVATYTFCKLIIAIVNKAKVRKEKSLLLTTLRNLSYSDALVSLLSLQTALFAAFGQDAGEFVPTMNAMTGACVCLMILGLGIFMVYNAKKIQAKAQIEEETKE